MSDLAYQVTGFAYQGSGLFAYQGSEDVPPTPSEIPQGGSGYPVWRKREPKSASNSLDMLWDLVAKEHYEAIVGGNVSKSVKKKAAQIVRPFTNAKKSVPEASEVDWVALDKNADAVASLLAVWSEQINQKMLDDDDDEFFMLN